MKVRFIGLFMRHQNPPIGKIMRKKHSCVASKLSAFVVLSFVAVAASVAKTNEQSKNGDASNNQEQEPAKAAPSESPSLFQKLEDMVGLSNKIEDLAKVAEKLKADLMKIRALHDETKDSLSKSNSPSSSGNANIVIQISESTSDSKSTEPPKPPATPDPSKPTIVAEQVPADSFDLVASDSLDDKFAMPVLSGDTPDWVKNGLNGVAQGNEHSFAICSTYLPDLEQCREDLKSKMMAEVKLYLEKNVLSYPKAKLPELTQEYVEKYWVKRGQLFDNVSDRPSGTYHQAWIGLHISSEQIAKVREWEKQSEREVRIEKAGALGASGVLVITLLSGAVGLLARREKAKLKG